MNRLKIPVCFILLVIFLSGCGATTTSSSSSLPDQFFARGSWRFSADETKYTAPVVEGVVLVSMTFTRQQGEQYLVEGQVTYDATSLTCDYISPFGDSCVVSGCRVTGSKDAEFTGVAEVRRGELWVKTNWLGYPDYVSNEYSVAICDDKEMPVIPSFSVYQSTAGRGEGGGMIDAEWSVPLTDRVFVDDLPADTLVDAEGVISINLQGEFNYFSGQGLIGFYRASE